MLETNPEVLIVAVGVSVLIVAVAVGWALDVFLDYAEREPEEPAARPVNRAALTAAEREQLMAAHGDVVRRHAARPPARVEPAHGWDRR